MMLQDDFAQATALEARPLSVASPLLARVGYLPAMLAPRGITLGPNTDCLLTYAGDKPAGTPLRPGVTGFESPIRLPRIGKRLYPPLGLMLAPASRNADPHAALAALAGASASGSAATLLDTLTGLWRRIDRVVDPGSEASNSLVLIEPSGLADRPAPDTIEHMIDAALAEGAELYLYGPGAANGHLAKALARRARGARAYPRDNPGLFTRASRVFTLSGSAGFEALIAGAGVTCFGTPFYSGWGLTEDRAPTVRQRGRLQTPALLVHALFTASACHADPVHGVSVCPEDALKRLERWVFALERHYLPGTTRAIGIPRWKQPMVEAHLPAETLTFAPSFLPSRDNVTRQARWSYPDGTRRPSTDGQMLFIEDGFLRSAGLGSNFHFPLSLAVDARAMHFDAKMGSDLETILQNADFSSDELALAADIRTMIVDGALTKYNLAAPPAQIGPAPGGRRRVLIAGQVPDDAAMRFGATGPRSAEDLARAVRAENPDAFIVFKEHPELVAGTRTGRSDPEILRPFVDSFLTHGSILDEIGAADEVHAITSLAGFEALLRGKAVTTWGVPFYAGWGLTRDMAPVTRRTRRLNLDELVAGALIRYPSYVDPDYAIHCSAEDAIRLLVRAARAAPEPLRHSPLPPWLANAKRFLDLVFRRDSRCFWLGDHRR